MMESFVVGIVCTELSEQTETNIERLHITTCTRYLQKDKNCRVNMSDVRYMTDRI